MCLHFINWNLNNYILELIQSGEKNLRISSFILKMMINAIDLVK